MNPKDQLIITQLRSDYLYHYERLAVGTDFPDKLKYDIWDLIEKYINMFIEEKKKNEV